MKTIGLLGGTGWSSTVVYYKLLNELVNERLGGYHSAKIILNSIDYHDIMENYGKNHDVVANLLKKELKGLIALNPDCVMICCNSLHKYFDMIKNELEIDIPVMHAIELTAKHIKKSNYNNVLLLATKFTMEDGFFENIIRQNNIDVTIPNKTERDEIQNIHSSLMQNTVSAESKTYFSELVKKYSNHDAVILGCTEFPLALNQENSVLPIIDPMKVQVKEAVDFSTSR